MNAVARAEAYDRHTGRYGRDLSAAFVGFAGIEPGMRVLDAGCGTGALTTRLAQIVGGDAPHLARGRRLVIQALDDARRC